jgi:3'-5' exonuclease
VWADDADSLLWLDRVFQNVLVILHGATHDLPVLQRLGIRVPRWVDTMQLAYHRCSLPIGLKSLAYRTVGMVMRDYDDVVGPYANEEAVRFLLSAYMHDWAPPDQDMRETKAGWRLYTPPSIHQRLGRCLVADDPRKSWEALLKDDDEGGDAYTRRVADRGAVEAVCGRMPDVGLVNVPQQEVIDYAGRDSDGTLRVWEWMGRPGL